MVLPVARRVHVLPDLATASDELARRLIVQARAAVSENGRYRLVISGGKTPLGLYASLAGRFRDRMPWADTELFFADERCVPPHDEASNFGAAWRTFLSSVPIPRTRVHRMRGELRPIRDAARRYARIIGDLPAPRAGVPPRFDTVLLGIGPDGHTASLFPGQPAVRERVASVVAVPHAGQPPDVPRLTLTVPALTNAASVWFLIAGEDKAPALRRIFRDGRGAGPPLPAGLIRPASPSEWFVDAAAATGIPASARRSS